ncbi:MAG: acetylglutamate kinase [Planctomycetes bacterium]|nr:acetylglutamate kinase [Planctomycetota bacterium]
MDKAISKADALLEALNYIQRFKGRIVVVKLGGSLMEEEVSQRDLLRDVVFMSTVGMQPILVHGGGKRISAAMQQAGIEPKFVQGIRTTDKKTLAIAEDVLVNEINEVIVGTLNELGGKAIGLHSQSSCVLFAERLQLEDDQGEMIDLGYVGKIHKVNTELLSTLCQAGTIPVIAPIARDGSGGKLNVNADSAAGIVAREIQADKLVMMSDTHGIFADQAEASSQFSQLDRKQVEGLIESGTINGGMLPKVEACLEALNGGVGRTHIIDGNIAHSLLLEIYTDQGVGTLIVEEPGMDTDGH